MTPNTLQPKRVGTGILTAIMISFLCPDATGQNIVINEAMSSNGATLRDEDGQSPDWIELYNPGDAAVDLAGHGLSDNVDPFKWVFPSVHILPKGHLIVFASEKDRRDTAPHWETVIDQGDDWRYLIPSSEPPASWRLPGFDDGSWSSGPTGIGYGDDDDRTVVPTGTVSVFARKTFQIADPERITEAFLDVDFDDAFVAFLNGEEIARANIPDLGQAPAFDDVAPDYTEPVMISGQMPWHYELLDIQALLRTGENVLAIQVHNTGSGSSDLTLIPFLTLGMQDVPANPRGTAELLSSNLPALHANFKIDADGEALTLTSPQGDLLDEVDTGYLPEDISIGRFPDGATTISFHADPTPGEANASAGYDAISGQPLFSHEGGFHVDPITLSLTTDDPTGDIYFTLDGLPPTTASPRYTAAISVDTSTVVRAAVLEDGAIPGKEVTHTFLIGESRDLPVVSISTDPANFFDDDIGIYVPGNNAEPNFPHFGANFWNDWERPVHLELFETDGSLGFSLDAGAKIFGGWSRGHPQHSLSFFARAQYGPGKIRYRIFPQKRIKSFESFVLRNAGNDWQNSHFRDGMMTSLLEDLNVDQQAYRPSVMFINGEYWGIMNLREKVNEHFLASNHKGVDEHAIDLLESNGRVIHGDAEHYQAVLTLLNSRDIRDPTVYADFQEMVDVDNFIDYQASQIYFDNTDWPGNNIKFWRPRVPGGRWRWILYDTDFGFGIWNANNYVNDTLTFALDPSGPNWPNPPWSTLMLRTLVRNDDFVRRFVNRFATHLRTIFTSEKVIERINEMAAVIAPEMPAQRSLFGGSVASWNTSVQTMRNFASRRPSYMRNHLASQFGLGDTALIRFSVDPPGGGAVEVEDLEIPSSPWSGIYFEGVPIRIAAVPRPGYRFTGWSEGIQPADQPATTLVLSGNSLDVSASFEIDCATVSEVVINEINYNAADGSDPGDWVEIHNRSGGELDLSGWTLEDESGGPVFTIPAGTSVAATSYLVLCSDQAAFAGQFPVVDNHVGDLGFALAGGGEILRLRNAFGDEVDSLAYEDEAPWPEEADGAGATLALKNPILDNTYAPHWAASASGGTPGSGNTDIFEDVDASCVPGAKRFRRGDCNNDGQVDISDAVCSLLWLFQGQENPSCLSALNVDGVGDVNITDPIYLLTYMFGNGPSPVGPFPNCGFGTLDVDEQLGCDAPPGSCQ